MVELNEYREIKVSCPVCKTEKSLKFPRSVVSQAKQLTTISIPKGLVCDHHFQAFVDKNFAVRGYQKVDFEFAYEVLKKNNREEKKDFKRENDIYKDLIIEGNYLEYNPINCGESMEKKNSKSRLKKMTLEEIYEEFREFIDDNNQDFKHLIEKDERRKKKV